ncbi:hypothetical protein AB0B89_11080 [Sphaerisporangium sp. NPDC049002]|uniref:hypothetical protein n=1 Tax=unclassified Sphaerisporangium TaxID=2630420 RepID=UPI0033F986BC
MKLNEKIAAGIAEEYLDRWRRVARYDELAVMEENDDKDWENVIGEDGQEYKILAYVLPHGGGTLRMVISVNHRRKDHAAADPLLREAVMRSDGTVTTPADLAELEEGVAGPSETGERGWIATRTATRNRLSRAG